MAKDWEDAPSADGWEDAPDDEGFGKKAVGALEATAAMFSGTPATIAGSIMGGGALLHGKGIDEAVRTMREIQTQNFGFGEYKPQTKKGAEYAETVSDWLQVPIDLAKKGGEAIAGNEGAYIGELLTGSALEMIDPALAGPLVARTLSNRKPSLRPKTQDQAALDNLKNTDGWEDAPTPTGRRLDIDLSQGPNTAQPMRVTKDGQGIANPEDMLFRDRALAETQARRVEGMSNETQQMELFDQPESGRVPNPTEAVTGDWRIDENGMPVKADLSMDAANVQNPLQRNLFGDELAPKHPQENISITQAMDNTRQQAQMAETLADADARLKEMQEQMDLLSFDIKTDPLLERGKLNAELRANTPRSDNPSIRSISPGGRQTGAFNPEVFKDGFEKLKQLADGTWLRAFSNKGTLTIEAIKDSHKLGGAVYEPANKFDAPSETNIYSPMVGVKPEARGKGLATDIYKFAAELGNDVQQSKMMTADGRRMWDSFEKKGLAKVDPNTNLRYIPRGQRGGVTPNLLTLGLLPKKNPLKKMTKQSDGTFIPDDPTPEQTDALIEQAQGEKDGKSAKYMDSGAALTAMKRGSTAIKVVAEVIGNAFKRADLAIRNNVIPAEKALKKLKVPQLELLGEIFKKEMFLGQRFTPNELQAFTPEILNGYRKMREMFDDSLKVQNEARVAKGQKPITPVEAYLSSRWQGDFRRPLYNAKGKLVWYLAAETKAGLDAQTRAVLKDHPDLTYDPKKDHTIRFRNRKTDLESAYTTMLDILGRDDPAVAVLQQYMEDQTMGRGATFLAQEKHFKGKGNVRGFIGDRPETTVNDYFDRTIPFGDKITVSHGKKSEMLDLFQQQIQYAKNAYRWSELQKAGQTVKKIINDPVLVDTQPNNIEFIREYFKHSIGYGESAATRAISDSLRNVGVSPAPFDKAIGGLKSYFILSKLAGNMGKITADAIQLHAVVPHMMDLRNKGIKGNPLTALAAGLTGGFVMGTGHQLAAWRGGEMRELKGFDFFNRAAKYAEENGVTSRSIYDESPIEQSFSKIGQLANVAGKTLTIPETYMRSVAFMTFAEYLRSSGKYKSEVDLFKEAEKRTNVAMVDYAQTERPMIFAKLGTAGNFLNTLQTYSWNFYNQQKYFYNEAKKGNVMPLITSMAMLYMVAGAMGIPGFEDIHTLWMEMKDALPARTWKKIQDNEFLAEPKLWMLKNMGQSSVYGYLSDKTGLGMTTRVAAPAAGQMMQSPLGPVTDVAKQVGAVGKLALDPTNQTKQAQAAMTVAPVSIQGLLETAPFMEDQTFVNRQTEDGSSERLYKRPTKLAERQGLITRTPTEENVRKYGFGIRAQSEVLKRDIGYATKRDTDAATKKARDLPNAFYDALRRGDKQDAAEYYETYTFMTGQKLSKESILNQAKEEFMTDIERQKTNAKRSVSALLNIKRMEEIFDSIEKESK